MKTYHTFFLLMFTYSCNAYRILGIFPIPAKSHFNLNNAVMKSLMDAGHQVTVVTSFPKQASRENYTSIIDSSTKGITLIGRSFDLLLTRNALKLLQLSMDLNGPLCDKIMTLVEIQDTLTSNKKLYDVIFVETMIPYQCLLPIAEKMKIPVIGILAFKQWQLPDHAIGNANHPGYLLFEGVTHSWTEDIIYARIYNLWNYLAILWYEKYIIPLYMQEFHQRHSQQLGHLKEYHNIKPSLIFYNNHPSILSRPMTPNAIEIGGIHVDQVKPLPNSIQQFIDGAKHGVILFSLGSVIKAVTLPPHIHNAFKEAFAEIPQRVIWKYEGKLENVSSNVMLLEWLPQRDILEHKNVKAFISHCGQGGMNEAIVTATPIIACPIFSDQVINARTLEKLQVAVRLNAMSASKEDVSNALNMITNDTKFNSNMEKLSTIFKDRPMTPQQTVVYWTEYVIRHNGAPHLRSAGSQLNWIQYLLIDVILFVILVTIISVYFIYFSSKIVINTCNKCWKKLSNQRLKNE